MTSQDVFVRIVTALASLQVRYLFWASLPPSQPTPEPLAYVQYYTVEGAGALDTTKLTRLVWELETRPLGDRFPGKVNKYDVLPVSDIVKLEHIVPAWAETGPRQHFYVNKYASFC